MERRSLLKAGIALGVGLLGQAAALWSAHSEETGEIFEVKKTEDEWRLLLTAEQFLVLRKEATEPPFNNKYYKYTASGTYLCAGCELPLFSSREKYDSKTGWPSFWKPTSDDAVRTKTDYKLLFPRTEVHCRRCGGHLGHIFKDGPPPTWLRYCINSAGLKFMLA